MAQLLHHQDSAFYGKELHGCRWGILQFFGFRRRMRSTKMISDKTYGQGKSSGGSRHRSSYTPLRNEDSGIMDDQKNTEVTKKQKASKRNSSKASLRSLILRKLYGKEGQKEKMLPVAPKLLRTISIHYLESNEYVLDGDSTSSGDGSSHSTKFSLQNATCSNLRHSTSSIPDGCGSDFSSSLLLKRDDSHVKRKSHRSISMDGVLHKVPYGKKVSGDIISEGLPRSASATYDRDGLKPYFGTAAKKYGFRRSRSLSESLENYSRLLDAISSSESKRILTTSKSIRDHSLDAPGIMTSLQRHSEVEFRSQDLGRQDENLVTAEDALALHVQEKTDADGDAEVTMNDSSGGVVADGSDKPALLEECINDKNGDVAVSDEEDSCIVPSPSEVADDSEEQAATCDNNDQVPSSAEVESCAAHSTLEEVDILEEHAETCDDAQIPSSAQADSCATLLSEDANIAEEQTPTCQIPKPIRGTSCVPDPSHKFEADISLSCEQESESPISVLDVAFSDDPVSQVKNTLLDDASLKPRILHLNGADVSTDTDIVHESDFDNLNGFKVDPSHEVEFNYVKDIFKKSSFSNEILLDEWYAQNITALQEEDCQHYEAAAAACDFTDMSTDQLLLFDLANEALLDIYKKYYVSKSKFSRFSSSGRPKPVGHRALKELWSRVSCRLNERPWSSIEVDTILSKDLAKSDRWVSFERDADEMGNKVAEFVFDKLLTELVLQLAEF